MEWFPIVRWIIATALLAGAGAPLAAALFERLPLRGGPFALHVSLMILLVVSFWVGHLRYGWLALLAGLAILGVLSALVYAQGVRPDWRGVQEGYLVFLIGFAGALIFRLPRNTIGPAGGEQFLHYGLLRAVRRSTSFPPEDMWFAGESVNYYYGGHTLVDQLARLSFVEPRIAYNLGMALVFGLAVAAAYGLVGALAEELGRDRRIGGTLGVFFLVLAGPLATAVRILLGALPESISTTYGEFAFVAIRQDWTIEEALEHQGSIVNWFWWHDRYVVPETLQEFPLYSLIKADLHGHVTTIPFMVLIAAVAYAYYLTPADERWRRRLIAFGALPALAGAVGWMNTWSLPGAVGIAWLALAFAPAHPLTLGPRSVDVLVERFETYTRPIAEAIRLAVATGLAGVVGVLGVAWIAPFILFQLPENDGIGFLPSQSPIEMQFLVWGGFLTLFAVYLGMVAWDRHASDGEGYLAIGVFAGMVIAAIVLVLIGHEGLTVGLPLLILAWWLVRNDYGLGFADILLIGGLGLVLSMELVYANVWPLDRQRWNTTYKVSMQAWILCALAAGAVATALIGDVTDRVAERIDGRSLAIAFVVVLIIGSMAAFPVLATGHVLGEYVTRDHVAGHSIDALDGYDRWRSDEMEAIYWLDARSGTPTLLEAPGGRAYTWGNPASTFTGLPTVAGWEHQRGYRGIEVYDKRVDEVDIMYGGPEGEAIDLLRHHEVRYIWVGPNERERYGTELRDFGTIEGIDVAFDGRTVTIFEVDHTRLPG